VKPTQSAFLAVPSPLPVLTVREGVFRSWVRFWFTPLDPVGFHLIRMLSGILFLCWLLPFAGNLDSLFGLQGWFDRQAFNEAARMQGGSPVPLGWSLIYAAGANPTRLATLYWVSLAIVALFTLGVWTRLTAVLTWFIIASFASNPVMSYDGEAMVLILAFYLMLGYLLLPSGDASCCWFTRLFGTTRPLLLGRWRDENSGGSNASVGVNLAVRLLQVHLAIVLVSSGLHKLQFGDWWAGLAFWYPLHPAFETTLASAREHAPYAESYLFFLSLGAYLTLAWEIGFPLFAWRSGWRVVVLGGGLVAWLGSSFFYGIPVIGPALFIACLSFVTPAGWQRLLAFLPRRQVVAPLSQEEEPAKNEKGTLVTVEQR